MGDDGSFDLVCILTTNKVCGRIIGIRMEPAVGRLKPGFVAS